MRITEKWTKTKNIAKKKFLEEVFKVNKLKGHIFYCRYKDALTYIPLTAFSVGKAIIQETKNVTTQVVRQCHALKNRHFSEKNMFLAKN